MARNLISNGNFIEYDDGFTGWTVDSGSVSRAGTTGGQFKTPYACRMDATAENCELNQMISVPGQAGSSYRARLTIRAKNTDDSYPELYLFVKLGPSPSYADYLYSYMLLAEVDQWCTVTADVVLPGNTQARLEIELTKTSYPTNEVYLDDIELVILDPLEMSAEGLALELMRRRADVAGILHARERYRQIVNESIRQVPERLWSPTVDTSTSTVADTRRYALSLTGLTRPGQVRRMWLEDTDGNDQQIGRWAIEDDAGTLTLVLDEDPPEAGRTITIEYLAPYATLDTLEFSDETTLDREWLLARAMTLLLLEASPELEPPDRIHQMLTYWDTLRQSRERELMGQQPRPSIRFRSTRWGDYV